jgi:putative drug exporter of the RND superfamily
VFTEYCSLNEEHAVLDRLTRWIIRRRRTVVIGSLIGLVLAGVFGGGVAEHLTTGGFEDPQSESFQARQVLEDEFGALDPQLVLLVTAPPGTSVDDPAVVAAGQSLTEELASEPGVVQVVSYWSLGSAPPLRSTPGHQALVLAAIAGDDDMVDETVTELSPRYTRPDGANGADGVISVEVGGMAEVFREVGDTIEADLTRAEAITLPITIILLMLIFGSVVAASLPLAVGIFAVLGTFVTLRVLSVFIDVSVYALNLTTALGLGLAIDYSLFIVSRYREEIREGRSNDEALRRTMQTAGKTVIFSAATVAISLSALLVFPLVFLRSFAYAGIAVVALAAFGALIVLPALLSMLGPRVDKGRFRRHRRPSAAAVAEGQGFWHRVAVGVMARPVPAATAVIAILLVLGAPFLHIEFGLSDDRVLPPSASSHQVHEQIRENFTSREASALQVVAQNTGDPARRLVEIDEYARALSTIDGVARVDALSGSYVDGVPVQGPSELSARFEGADGTWLSVVPGIEPLSAAGEAMARDVRDLAAPFAVDVAGPSADLIDSKSSLFGRMPLAALIIALVTFVVMFMMTGSVVVPVKALVMNLLSLSATFGAMVFIFQDGHLSGLLGFTATGSLDATMPILMFCIAFGLSMDYEVFLLSRIKEEYDRTGDNEQAVGLGLERTGRIVTAASALLAFVFVAFASSGISFIKMFGLGLAMAVVVDATLVRGVLVPAFMKLAGRANWWAPAPLRRFHDRFGVSETLADEPIAAGHTMLVEAPLVEAMVSAGDEGR